VEAKAGRVAAVVNLPESKKSRKSFMPLTLVLSVGLDPALLATRNLVLQSAGYIVASVASVREAVDRFKGGDFDLMVLCHSIPERDRGWLTCLIRASGSHIPVVAVSARPYERDGFADLTLDDDPYKFLEGVGVAMLNHAKIWTAQMPTSHGKQETAAASAKKVPVTSNGSEQPQRDTQGSERSFGFLALAGWHPVSG
jgi:CheY-like chemotaxis protein